MVNRRTVLTFGALGAAGAVTAGGIAPAVADSDTEASGTEPGQGGRFGWIIDCDGWDARSPDGDLEPSETATNKIVLHHMAFPNVDDFSRKQAVALAQECQDLHMDDNGWVDTGQHFTVSRGGYVLEGRTGSLDALREGDHQLIAAHCPGENGRAIGIENEGTYVDQTPPARQVAGLVRLCATICRQYGLYAHDIFGHWDFRLGTQCPGADFYKMFPDIRRRVALRLGTWGSEIPDRRWPDAWRFEDSPVVAVMQYLLTAQGYDLDTEGEYDEDTLDALEDFQKEHDLEPDGDGTFTSETWEAAITDLDRGDEGPAVRALQLMLEMKEYGEVEVDGEFGERTARGVAELQASHRLPRTGRVDRTTWCAAVGGAVRETFLF